MVETTPKESTPEPPSDWQRLCQLEKELMTSTKWKEKDRLEILALRELFRKSPVITQKHLDALRRQSVADQDGNPALSDEERKLIREANSV